MSEYSPQPRSDKERIATLEANYLSIMKAIESFVTQDQFLPVKLIAYGLAAIVLTSVLVSVIGRVLLK
jgi:hypothetical protein